MSVKVTFMRHKGRRSFPEGENRKLFARIFEGAGFTGDFDVTFHHQVSGRGGDFHQGLSGVQFMERDQYSIRIRTQVGDGSTRHEFSVGVPNRGNPGEFIRQLTLARDRLITSDQEAEAARIQAKSRSPPPPKEEGNGAGKKDGHDHIVPKEDPAAEVMLYRSMIDEETKRIEEIDKELTDLEGKIFDAERAEEKAVRDMEDLVETVEDLHKELFVLEEEIRELEAALVEYKARLSSKQQEILREQGVYLTVKEEASSVVSTLKALKHEAAKLRGRKLQVEKSRSQAEEEVEKIEAQVTKDLEAILRVLRPDQVVRIATTRGEGQVRE